MDEQTTSSLRSVMSAIMVGHPTKKRKRVTISGFSPHTHICKLFIPGEVTYTGLKTYTCVECAHKTYSFESLPEFRSTYEFGDDNLNEGYFAALELQILETKQRNVQPCRLCKFHADPARLVIDL